MSKRRGLAGLFIAGLATLGLSLTGAAAQASTVSFNPVSIAGSSHCLDNATENAARLQMWSCTGGSEQNWLEVFSNATGTIEFLNQHTGWCATAPATGTGTVVMAPCNAANRAQQWRAGANGNVGGSSGSYNVWVNASSLNCLSTRSVAPGTLVQTSACNFYTDPYYRWHG
jgi:hypothetical protein